MSVVANYVVPPDIRGVVVLPRLESAIGEWNYPRTPGPTHAQLVHDPHAYYPRRQGPLHPRRPADGASHVILLASAQRWSSLFIRRGKRTRMARTSICRLSLALTGTPGVHDGRPILFRAGSRCPCDTGRAATHLSFVVLGIVDVGNAHGCRALARRGCGPLSEGRTVVPNLNRRPQPLPRDGSRCSVDARDPGVGLDR